MICNLLGGLATAFSMYSILPMPRVEWNKITMQYALCFFPAVGLVCGGAVYGWIWLCAALELHSMLAAAGIVLLPVLLSGGIHLDGLLDTADALGSHQEKERKLEILKDSHVGAFGVIRCGAYLLLSWGLAGQLYGEPRLAPLLCIGYVASRACSAMAFVCFPLAKNTGLARLFSDNAQKNAVRVVSVAYLAFCAAAALFIHLAAGAVWVLLVAGWIFWFRRLCVRQFGGVTGDLAGYSLCTLELISLAVAALGTLLP